MKNESVNESQRFASIWDALEEDPFKRENLKLRSKLIMEINAKLDEEKKTQGELAKILKTTQPRVSALRQGKINAFRLDALVDMAVAVGLHISLNVAA